MIEKVESYDVCIFMMMGISTSIIGILPPAASAGVGVVIVLQLMRLAQCFGRGGTWGGGILNGIRKCARE